MAHSCTDLPTERTTHIPMPRSSPRRRSVTTSGYQVGSHHKKNILSKTLTSEKQFLKRFHRLGQLGRRHDGWPTSSVSGRTIFHLPTMQCVLRDWSVRRWGRGLATCTTSNMAAPMGTTWACLRLELGCQTGRVWVCPCLSVTQGGPMRWSWGGGRRPRGLGSMRRPGVTWSEGKHRRHFSYPT
jgi:hypothetical protein